VAVVDQHVDTATVLFTDVVGSTALRTRLGEEAADELRTAHDRLVADAITAKRGTVVKHTGDGAMATFSAAVDAVAAAVAIQQAVDRHNRRSSNERFEVRVGISVGDVTFDGTDCFGLPVIEAQRLESVAIGGQILCAELVRHLTRGRGGHQFASVGELELKGIPDPVPTAEIRWERAVQAAVPRDVSLPPALSGPTGFDLAGRAAELETLASAWKEAESGRRVVVLLSGEPGIGKTRLAIETARSVRDDGGLVLAGRCDEEIEIAYQPFAEALRFQVGLGDDAPTSWFGPLTGDLTRLVPELGDQVTSTAPRVSGEPEAERAQLFEAVTGWLRATASAVPVMLVLDDLHWADRATLQLVRHLIRETANDPLLIVGTYRSTDLDRAHPLADVLADLRREGSVTRLALDGLSDDGVAELLRRAAGHELDDAGLALADAVSAETGGNPFFVGEVVRHLVESGALVQRDGRWTSDVSLEEIGLPEGVREVIGRRLSKTDPDTQRLLSVAAVIGYEFALPVLARVADLDEDTALDRLEPTVAAGLVVETGLDRYRFGHALLRATLIDELTTSRRVRTHLRIAQAIEATRGDDASSIAELAYHYGEAAAAGAADKAVHYATRAGDLANRSSAPDEAIRWYSLALEHLELADGDVAVEVDLRTRLGNAQWSVGTGDPTTTLRQAAEMARAAGLYPQMAEALLVSGRTSFDRGQPPDPVKIEMLDEVLLHLDDQPSLRARAMGALAVELIFVGDVERRSALLDEAVALARELADPMTVADVSRHWFNARRRSNWNQDSLRSGRQLTAEAIAAAEQLGDTERLASALSSYGFLCVVAGDRRALLDTTRRIEQLATEQQHPVAARMVLFVNQHIAAVDGRLAEAEALSAEQYEAFRSAGLPGAETYRSIQRYALRREQGRLGELVAGLERFVDASGDAGVAEAMLAFAQSQSGDPDDAASRLDQAARSAFATVPDDASWPVGIALWAETTAVVGDHQAAEQLHRLLTPLDGNAQFCTGGVQFGPVARLLGRLEDLLGRTDEADLHYEQGLDQSRRFETPLWTARCALDWAESLVGRARAGEVAELLAEVDAAMADLSLPAVEAQAGRLRSLVEPA
jgi:class 3 adenylate cyclase/tetratricopeptide (TPR) repeat protein